MRRGRKYLVAGLIGAAIIGPVQAQDGGSQGVLTLTPGWFIDDDDSRARLGFGARVESATRTQRLSFGLNGSFDSGYDDLSESLRAPTARLSYVRESAATALNASISYRRAEISALEFDEDQDGDFLVLGTGQRADRSAKTSLTFGRDGPFGGTVSLGYSDIEYIDNVDPALLDESTKRAGLSLRFTIDPRLTATLAANGSETEVDSPLGTDQSRRSLSAGLDMAVSATLNASFNLGGSRIVETSASGEDTTEGGTAAFSLTRDLVNGALSGGISTDVTTAGRLTKLEVDRTIDLPRGTLRFGSGLAEVEGEDVQALARLSWSDETPRTKFGLTVERALAVDSDGDAALNSFVSLSLQRDMSVVSNLGVSLSLRDTNLLDAAQADSRRTDLSLSYGHDLTQNWAFRASYTHRWITETGSDESREQSLFLGLERGFQWRP